MPESVKMIYKKDSLGRFYVYIYRSYFNEKRTQK